MHIDWTAGAADCLRETLDYWVEHKVRPFFISALRRLNNSTFTRNLLRTAGRN